MKRLFCLLSLTLSLSLFASPVKSSVSATGIAYIEDSSTFPSAADYVQDGLVAMWDGIENVGWGIHSDTTDTWVDLTGNGRDFILNSNAVWLASGITRKNGSIGPIGIIAKTYEKQPFTSELVFYDNSTAPRCCALSWRLISSNAYYGWETTGVRMWRAYNLWGNNPYVYLDKGTLCSLSYGFQGQGSASNFLYKDSEAITTKLNNNTGYGCGALFGSAQYPTSERYSFDGIIYCCRVYSRLLTEKEVRYNYLIDQMRFNLQ